MLEFETNYDNRTAVIKVVGTGGGGCNAVDTMIDYGLKGVSYIGINTDRQALERCKAETKIVIGEQLTGGLGAGGNPKVGQEAAEETLDQITKEIEHADMVFITTGMGGGTGTGSAPIIAQAAKSLGILTVGVVTKPFDFEGPNKMATAEKGISYLKNIVDSLVVVPNQKLLSNCDKNTTMLDAFKLADDVLRQGVQGISDLISDTATINVDFADVKTVMTNKGIAHMGIGHASGENRAKEAVKAAIESPLLETSIDGAKAVLLYISGGYDLGMFEVNEIASTVQEKTDKNSIFKFGASFNEGEKDEITVTVIATGFELGGIQEEDFEDVTSVTEEKDEPAHDEVRTTVNGVNAREVELKDIVPKEGEDEGESKFDLPTFLEEE